MRSAKAGSASQRDQCLLSVSHGRQAVAFAVEELHQDFAIESVVIDDQDAARLVVQIGHGLVVREGLRAVDGRDANTHVG